MIPFILYDTEFTAWPGSQQNNWSRDGEHKEIIQLAALKVVFDENGLTQLSSLNVLVCPRINPCLSDYIKELTGIEQALLDDHGIDFESCARQFREFNEQGKIRCFSWGPDQQVLRENYQLNQLQWDYAGSCFMDLKNHLFTLGLDFRTAPSGTLAKCVGIQLEGHIHNALYDVRSMAAFLDKLVRTEKLSIADLLNITS
jgi:inhibitor of KinA sporulation pathway (predicted exonuclease)